MHTHFRSLPAAVSLAIVMAVVATLTTSAGRPVIAGSCDEPGTPNQEQLRSDGHRQLVYSFENTARSTPHERSDETGKVTVYFDMNMGDGNNPSDHNWTYVEGEGPHALANHERLTLRISTQQTQRVNPANRRAEKVDRPLEAGRKYCMTVWSRTSPGGCRSAQHSSWKCAVVQP